MSNYSEIAQLSKLISDLGIKIIPGTTDLSGLTKVDFHIRNEHFTLVVDDEYNDLSIPSPELHLCLLLFHLETYEESEDFLQWCQFLGLDATNVILRNYHLELRTIVPKIWNLLKISSCPVYHLDYELGSGPIGELRKTKP